MLQTFKHSTQLQFLIATVAVLVALYTWRGPQKTIIDQSPHVTTTPTNTDGERLFTADQLEKFDGSDGSQGIYIAILGKIYDVEKGRRHYGPGGSYSFFAGQDATNSFITGDFETKSDDLDDVLKLTSRDILAVWNWQKFYEKDYVYVGKLVGRYYDDHGQETPYMQVVKDEVRREELNNEQLEKEKKEFPPCNTEWKAETGSTFWCSKRSGGVERDWEGVPRKMYKPGQSDFNCVCVHESKLGAANLEEFEGCDPQSTKCTFDLPDNVKQ